MPEEMASKEAVDSIYEERNAVVLAFVSLAVGHGWKGGVKFFADDPLWAVVLLDTPQGQIGWHLPFPDVPADFPSYDGEWDGHDTKLKYQRLSKLVRALDDGLKEAAA